MCELNTKITIAQLLRLNIVTAKSKIYSPRRGYLLPGNSIVLGIAATLFIIHQRHNFFADFGAHFVETQARFQQTFVTYAQLTVHYNKNFNTRMQICYARKLHNMTKFHKTWKSHKIFSSETIIETNNIFAILEAKKPSYFN